MLLSQALFVFTGQKAFHNVYEYYSIMCQSNFCEDFNIIDKILSGMTDVFSACTE